MLKEIMDVRQNPGEDFRRVFRNVDYDLFIWFNEKEEISAFQLCYEKRGIEKALSWNEKKGFSHDQVESGEDIYQIKRASALKSMDGESLNGLIRQFKKVAGMLELSQVEFILGKLKEYQKSK